MRIKSLVDAVLLWRPQEQADHVKTLRGPPQPKRPKHRPPPEPPKPRPYPASDFVVREQQRNQKYERFRKRIVDLHAEGLSDITIAESCGAPLRTVKRIRQELNLPHNNGAIIQKSRRRK